MRIQRSKECVGSSRKVKLITHISFGREFIRWNKRLTAARKLQCNRRELQQIRSCVSYNREPATSPNNRMLHHVPVCIDELGTDSVGLQLGALAKRRCASR